MSGVSVFLAAAAISFVLDLSDRSEVRLRDSGEAAGRVVDLETAPVATLGLRTRTGRFSLGYLPRFTLRQLDAGQLPEAIHRGALAGSVRGRSSELTVDCDLARGSSSFTSLVPLASVSPGATSVDRLPPTSTIEYLSSRATVSATYALGSRWTFRALAEHSLSGGADARSREVIPFQSGPRGAFRATHAFSRRDHLASAIEVSRTLFSSGPDDVIGEATEAWRHVFDRRTEGTLGVGAAMVIAREREPYTWITHLHPVADATLTHRAPAPGVEGTLSLRLAPIVDRLSGLVDERLQGSVAVAWALTPRLALRTQFGAAQSVQWNRDGAVTLVLGEAAFLARASPATRIELGTRVASQDTRGAGAPSTRWLMFAGATFTLPSIRF